MRLIEFLNTVKITEAEQRLAEYGYWITSTGKVIPIMKQFDHEANAARFLGKTPQPAHPELKWYYGGLAMEAGWVRVVAPNPESHYVLEFEKKRTTTLSRPQILAVKSILTAHRKDPNLKEITIHDPYQKFWNYQDAMEFLNGALTESRLTEGASPVLYHYTTVTNLEPILQNNEFSMATSYGTGAETPHDVKGAPYYLSTTRHKLGAYHSTGANYSVMLVLDGAALAQRYKIKPVDYWDAGPERSESEDRVFSREQTIPNASKYIKEIHMITEDPDRTSFSSDVVRRMTRRLLINAKKRGVPIYLYRDSKAWLLQDKRKALPISQALDQPEEKAGKRYSSMRTNWFKPWIELYHKRTAEELSPEAARLLRNLRYDDYNGEVTRRLLNTVHNDKRSPNVVALIKLMQQNRLSTVAEYTALIKKKWGITEAVDFERITPIKKQPKFPWGAQIGQTATTQANTYDIGRPGTVIKKIRIENENESIIDFFKLIMRNQDNPFFPRIYNAKMYQNPKAKGLTLIVEMEKLKELTDEMLIDTAPHLLKQIGIEVEREMFDKTWTLALEMMSKMDKPDARASLKKMSKNPKFVEAMNILERGFAQYGSDLHYQNLMVRLTPHGPQLVIIDPFLPGTERYKDDDRE